jgi:hypothetical protein
MTSSSKKVDPVYVLSATTLGDFRKRFYSLVVKDGHAPSVPGDDLITPLLCLYYVIFEVIVIHNAKSVGLGTVFVSYTDADMVHWSTDGHPDVIPELILGFRV